MNTSFQIIELNKEPNQTKVETHSFSLGLGRSILFASLSLTVAISMISLDIQPIQYQSKPVFANAECLSSAISKALYDEYETQNSILKRLELLKDSLKENWDKEGGLPIEEQVFNNAKLALSSISGGMLKYWHIFPNPNGTILLSPKNRGIAGISIGNEDFSYAAYISDSKQISGKEPFSVETFKIAIKQIHRILGYV